MRITKKMIESRVNYLNELTKSPKTTYSKTENGYKANIGNFHISGAYGGFSLHRISNTGGGVYDVFNCGHTTMKDLYNRINAYISCINDIRNNEISI